MLAFNEGTERVSIPSRGISGSTLKLIAIVTMMIDHLGAALIENGILRIYDLAFFRNIMESSRGLFWYYTDVVCRLIGRISFPLFCFLLVEGFFHTRNWKRYTARMFLFAILSEIPFDLTFAHTPFSAGSQNIFFTLGIGLLVLAGLNRFRFQEVWEVLIIALGCGAAYFLRTDYSFFGIILIVSLYMLHESKSMKCLTGAFLMAHESIAYYGSGALAFIPVWFYNGTRGNIKLKYFFYWFYPAHLLFLYLFRTFVMKM